MPTTIRRPRPVALVTGGSRGIGAATAVALARAGHDLLLSYVSRGDAAARTVAECEAAGADARAVQVDLAKPDGADALFVSLDEEFGRLDVLVNNAGILPPSARVADLTGDRVRSTLAVNAVAPARCAALAVRRMSSAGGGRGGVVVNVSSRAAVRGAAGEFVDYAMSKAALDILTVGLAAEVGPEGIRVVGVRPGLIEGEMNAGQPGRIARLIDTVPLGRAGTAAEVAAVITWLVSADAGYITGVTLDVSGGR